MIQNITSREYRIGTYYDSTVLFISKVVIKTLAFPPGWQRQMTRNGIKHKYYLKETLHQRPTSLNAPKWLHRADKHQEMYANCWSHFSRHNRALCLNTWPHSSPTNLRNVASSNKWKANSLRFHVRIISMIILIKPLWLIIVRQITFTAINCLSASYSQTTRIFISLWVFMHILTRK